MSYKVAEAKEEHGQAILKLAYEDPVLNALLLYDWLVLRRERPSACDFYVALEALSGRIAAACVVYHDKGFDSIIFCGSGEAVKAIIEAIEPEKALMPRVLPEELNAILGILGNRLTSVYNVFLMTCSPEDFRPVIKHPVVQLGPEHAELFWRFCVEELGREMGLEEARERLAEQGKPVFAIIKGGRIVSSALIYASLPEVSLLGGVFTVPELRGRGLATSVTSRATQAALERSDLAALIVREENEPALKVYRKLGYRVYKRLRWLNIGVDIRP